MLYFGSYIPTRSEDLGDNINVPSSPPPPPPAPAELIWAFLFRTFSNPPPPRSMRGIKEAPAAVPGLVQAQSTVARGAAVYAKAFKSSAVKKVGGTALF